MSSYRTLSQVTARARYQVNPPDYLLECLWVYLPWSEPVGGHDHVVGVVVEGQGPHTHTLGQDMVPEIEYTLWALEHHS